MRKLRLSSRLPRYAVAESLNRLATVHTAIVRTRPMAEESILAKMQRADEMHMAAEENLRNARRILDEIAAAMGFTRASREIHPHRDRTPYPALSEDALDRLDALKTAAGNSAADV